MNFFLSEYSNNKGMCEDLIEGKFFFLLFIVFVLIYLIYSLLIFLSRRLWMCRLSVMLLYIWRVLVVLSIYEK